MQITTTIPIKTETPKPTSTTLDQWVLHLKNKTSESHDLRINGESWSKSGRSNDSRDTLMLKSTFSLNPVSISSDQSSTSQSRRIGSLMYDTTHTFASTQSLSDSNNVNTLPSADVALDTQTAYTQLPTTATKVVGDPATTSVPSYYTTSGLVRGWTTLDNVVSRAMTSAERYRDANHYLSTATEDRDFTTETTAIPINNDITTIPMHHGTTLLARGLDDLRTYNKQTNKKATITPINIQEASDTTSELGYVSDFTTTKHAPSTLGAVSSTHLKSSLPTPTKIMQKSSFNTDIGVSLSKIPTTTARLPFRIKTEMTSSNIIAQTPRYYYDAESTKNQQECY